MVSSIIELGALALSRESEGLVCSNHGQLDHAPSLHEPWLGTLMRLTNYKKPGRSNFVIWLALVLCYAAKLVVHWYAG
jgi:hypothetical protein